jgi:hypothetical protein
MHAKQLRRNQPQSSGVSGPAGVNVQGRLPNRGPMTQPMQQQLSLQQQRVGKRTNTSPGEEVRRCSPGHRLNGIGLLIAHRFVSINHFPDMTSPRQVVSANAWLL